MRIETFLGAIDPSVHLYNGNFALTNGMRKIVYGVVVIQWIACTGGGAYRVRIGPPSPLRLHVLYTPLKFRRITLRHGIDILLPFHPVVRIAWRRSADISPAV